MNRTPTLLTTSYVHSVHLYRKCTPKSQNIIQMNHANRMKEIFMGKFRLHNRKNLIFPDYENGSCYTNVCLSSYTHWDVTFVSSESVWIIHHRIYHFAWSTYNPGERQWITIFFFSFFFLLFLRRIPRIELYSSYRIVYYECTVYKQQTRLGCIFLCLFLFVSFVFYLLTSHQLWYIQSN